MKVFILLYFIIGTTYGYPYEELRSNRKMDDMDHKMDSSREIEDYRGEMQELVRELENLKYAMGNGSTIINADSSSSEPNEQYFFHSIKEQYTKNISVHFENKYDPQTKKIVQSHTILDRRIPYDKSMLMLGLTEGNKTWHEDSTQGRHFDSYRYTSI